jgi:uncharacterized protein (DUF58 family)
MFFNSLWLYGSGALLIYGMAFRQPAITVIATLLLLTAGISWLWNHYALRRVTYTRRLGATRVFRDETITLRLELVNRKLLPLAWIEVEDELPDRLEALDRRLSPSTDPAIAILPYLTSLRPYERVAWTATLRCPHRGIFTIGPTTLRSGDIFGFHRCEERFNQRDAVIVYPRVIPLPELGIPPRGAFGDTRTRHSLLLDPQRTVGTRDYHPEDSFRHIHWKATARAGSLQVRVFEPTTVTQLAIFLDLDTLGQSWRALDSVDFEPLVSVGASIAAHAIEEGRAVGIYSNRLIGGSNRPLRVAPASGVAQLTKVLESLAKLSPFTTVEFSKHLRAATLNFPWGSTIVIVTAGMPPALAATLEALRGAGHRLVLVATAPLVPPPVRGLITHHLPAEIIERERRATHGPTPTIPTPAEEAAPAAPAR